VGSKRPARVKGRIGIKSRNSVCRGSSETGSGVSGTAAIRSSASAAAISFPSGDGRRGSRASSGLVAAMGDDRNDVLRRRTGPPGVAGNTSICDRSAMDRGSSEGAGVVSSMEIHGRRSKLSVADLMKQSAVGQWRRREERRRLLCAGRRRLRDGVHGDDGHCICCIHRRCISESLTMQVAELTDRGSRGEGPPSWMGDMSCTGVRGGDMAV
jgi:hypothetical protein